MALDGSPEWMVLDSQEENERCAIAGSFDDNQAVKQTRDPKGFLVVGRVVDGVKAERVGAWQPGKVSVK